MYQTGEYSAFPELPIAHMQIIAVACQTLHVQEAVDVFHNLLMIHKSKKPSVCHLVLMFTPYR